MKTSTEGFQQAYNAQAAVDGESRLIVAVDVSSNPSDAGQLQNMLDKSGASTGLRAAVVLADSGYASEDAFNSLEDAEVNAYVAQGRQVKVEGARTGLPGPPAHGRPARQRGGQEAVCDPQAHRRTPVWLDKAGAGVQALQRARTPESAW